MRWGWVVGALRRRRPPAGVALIVIVFVIKGCKKIWRERKRSGGNVKYLAGTYKIWRELVERFGGKVDEK